MAEGKSFADFLKESREKKKNETLAQQILGSRGRKANASGAGAGGARSKPQKPDLLSRMSGNGIQKRSSSAKPVLTANIDGKWQHDLHKLNNPNGPAPKKLNRTASASQIDRNTRTFDKFASIGRNAQRGRLNDGPQLSIKGAASTGPHTLIASNFASGTTAQDIESVMGQIGGDLLSCRVVVPTPTVMAELTFATREGCDNVIATFNNKKADGKVLYVYYKSGPSTGISTAALHSRPSSGRLMPQSYDDMDIDTNAGARAGTFSDGRYGFNENGRKQPPSGPRKRF